LGAGRGLSLLAVILFLLYTEIDMEHHAVPQQISEYEFRLVGSMTLKQFIKLAGGLILAFVFYSTNLIFFIKWPLVIGFSSLGAALAFLPVNEQPLEKWLQAFFNSIYSPTIYVWQKQTQAFEFSDQYYQPPSQPEPEEEGKKEDKEPKLEEFLASIDENEPSEDKNQTPKNRGEEKKDTAKTQKPEAETKVSEKTKEQKNDDLVFNLPSEKLKPTAEAEFGEIPMPEPPDTPNKIVGMVFDAQGNMVENAIIEIQDENGNAVRALRTNRLGQFETATALTNGSYIVSVEKEDYNFDILKIEAKGEVLEPLIIKAKEKSNIQKTNVQSQENF